MLAEDVGELVQTNVLAVGLARPLLHDDYVDLREGQPDAARHALDCPQVFLDHL